jgi:hypothetical protein
MITFLQSGFDKLSDWKNNLNFLTDHFNKTIFKNYVPAILGIVMVVEIISGLLAFIGIFQIYLSGITTIGYFASVLSCSGLLMLLLGQRIAKDYAGAMTIVVYFMVSIFGVYILS